jgi:hypothetical protein
VKHAAQTATSAPGILESDESTINKSPPALNRDLPQQTSAQRRPSRERTRPVFETKTRRVSQPHNACFNSEAIRS